MVMGVKRAPRRVPLACPEVGREALDPKGETTVVARGVSSQRRSGNFGELQEGSLATRAGSFCESGPRDELPQHSLLRK